MNPYRTASAPEAEPRLQYRKQWTPDPYLVSDLASMFLLAAVMSAVYYYVFLISPF